MSLEASLARILIPTPSVDFDPSEVAVSWQLLTQGGHNVVFATPDGRMARGDEVMLTGEGLDPWGFAPGLRRAVVIGRVLRAGQDARDAYAQMQDAAEFRAPIRWDEINLAAVDGVLLPGGHRAQGMRRYLESELLQGTVVEAFGRGMPVAVICHGALLAARSTDPDTGRSVLYERKTTSLTWSLERRAWQLARITRFWDRDYYRTYQEQPGQPAGYMSVQAEVTRALAANDDFQDVSPDDPNAARKISGRYRDTLEDERPAFVVQDGSYLSARWPGDVHTFAKRFAAILRREEEKPRIASPSGRPGD
jgi:putative intracellular protease/amidase